MEKMIILLILLSLVFVLYQNEFAQERTEMMGFSFEAIVLPVKAHLITEPSEYYTSRRDEENVLKLFQEVNRIWDQGGVSFRVEGVEAAQVSERAIPAAINGNSTELQERNGKGMIHVFFTQSLNGINGIALNEIDSILVADDTTVNDFRATAHELGHLLGLGHVPQEERLMARGKNGEFLAVQEILLARKNSLHFKSQR